MTSLAHFFIPHHKNKYRAHLLKPLAIQLAIFAIIGLQFSFLFIKKTYPAVLGVSYTITTQEIIGQTNDWRGKSGLPALRENGPLNVAAQLKGQDMLAKGYWAHTSPDGLEPWYWINKSGYNYQRAGENLAKDFRDTTSTVNAWMNSPGHKANIMSPYYKDIGIAVVSGSFNGYDTVIVVQMFGEPSGLANSLQNPQPAAAQAPQLVGKSVSLSLNNDSSTSSTTSAISPNNTLIKPDEIQTKPIENPIKGSPAIDPVEVFKTVVFTLGTFFIGMLLLDAYLVAKKRVVRKNHGHSMLHAIFLATIMITLLIINTGVVL
jgi:hypothetical protein